MELTLAAAALILGLASAFFSALETALSPLNALQSRRLLQANPDSATILKRLLHSPPRLRSVVLTGNGLVNILLLLILWYFVSLQPGTALSWLLAVILFGAFLVFCELAPKLAVITNSYRLPRRVPALLERLQGLLEPAAGLFQLVSNRLTRPWMRGKTAPAEELSPEELETLLLMSREHGIIDAVEEELIREILKMAERTAKDCMTPRVDMLALSDDLDNEEALATVKACRYRRVPVYAETPDQIVGILNVRRLLLAPATPFLELIDAPSYIASSLPALKLLKLFQTHPQGLAIVVDEFGGTEGMITRSDLIEAIVQDAVPRAGETAEIREIADGHWIVGAGTRLDDLNDSLPEPLPEAAADTLGGMIFNHLGRLPKRGELVEWPPYRFTIRRTSRRRIDEIGVDFQPPPGEETS